MFPTWKKLEELVDKGKIKNIGVSKYVLFIGRIHAQEYQR